MSFLQNFLIPVALTLEVTANARKQGYKEKGIQEKHRRPGLKKSMVTVISYKSPITFTFSKKSSAII